MKENELKPELGARRRSRRVGRGDGSGRGSYSGRGIKGQKSRTGGGVRRGFAGGQLSFIKGLPSMRGFTNTFRTEYAAVNLERLNRFAPGTRVTLASLKEAGILKSEKQPVKVLAGGTLNASLTVAAHRFSKAARAAIEAAGGVVEQL